MMAYVGWVWLAVCIVVIANTVIGKWEKYKYESCPGHELCGQGICTKVGVHGCPVSPNGEFMTAEEHADMIRSINEG